MKKVMKKSEVIEKKIKKTEINEETEGSEFEAR
jgi:hypothetical protein